MTGLRRAVRTRSAPKPVRRVRVAGVRDRKVAVEPEVEVEPEVAAAEEPSPARPPLHRRVPSAVLVAVTVVAAALAVWSTVEARGLRAGGAANTALTDIATTRDVTAAVRTAVESAFSYDYGDVDRTRTAARQVLVGRAVQQYDDLYAQVVAQAQARRLVLTTSVRSIGVTELRGDRAVALVFVDQQIVQTGDGAHDSGASQLSVTAGRHDGAWLIEDITVL
ncbi:hypothetical protein ACQEVB_15230 [Pseudonocardia sp. CA-107938]|uniref:hypothetical protein n=1 Tax=Pseudonocardia sp. CA-107938 TaxID=3240021 RepID=UPI003D8BAA1E